MRNLICFLLFITFNSFCQARIHFFKVATFPVVINSPDSVVRATIMNSSIHCKPKLAHIYYWYENSKICTTEGGFSGRLLHGKYASFYPDHNLKEQGVFNRGLKDGRWTRWHNNGKVHELLHFSHGKLNGAREVYDPSGKLLMRIYYKNGARSGITTIFSQDKPDSTIRYKKGVIVTPKKKKIDSSDKKKLPEKESKRKDVVDVKKKKAGNDSVTPRKSKKEAVKKVDSAAEKKVHKSDSAKSGKLKDFFRPRRNKKAPAPGT